MRTAYARTTTADARPSSHRAVAALDRPLGTEPDDAPRSPRRRRRARPARSRCPRPSHRARAVTATAPRRRLRRRRRLPSWVLARPARDQAGTRHGGRRRAPTGPVAEAARRDADAADHRESRGRRAAHAAASGRTRSASDAARALPQRLGAVPSSRRPTRPSSHQPPQQQGQRDGQSLRRPPLQDCPAHHRPDRREDADRAPQPRAGDPLDDDGRVVGRDDEARRARDLAASRPDSRVRAPVRAGRRGVSPGRSRCTRPAATTGPP